MHAPRTRHLAEYLALETITEALTFIRDQFGSDGACYVATALVKCWGQEDGMQLAKDFIDCETTAEQLAMAERWLWRAMHDVPPQAMRRQSRRLRVQMRAVARARAKRATKPKGPIAVKPLSPLHATMAKVLRGKSSRLRIAAHIPRVPFSELHQRRELEWYLWRFPKRSNVQ